MGYLSYLIITLGLTVGIVIGYVSRIICSKVETFAFGGLKKTMKANSAVVLANILAIIVSTALILVGFVFALLIPSHNWSFFSNAFLIGAILGIWIYRYLISIKKI